MADPQLVKQFKQKMSYAVPTGVGTDGELVYARPRTMQARVEPVDRSRELNRGTQLGTTYRIYTEVEIKMDYRVWLPGDSSLNARLARRPKYVLELVDEFGIVDHYEVDV
tara:strand:- start:3112 stop:3441 length:330 start_codon:yes stop_codon:yes gene_type:complete